MQAQLDILKSIAVNLGLACKLAVDELLKRKTLWGQSKPPLPAMLMSMNYRSHAMIFSFLEYAPIPKNVWRELNFIYTFAQNIGQENNTIVLPGKSAKTEATSISHAYKKIVLASLADPHHLPFGAIWEIFEQLHTWAEFAQISKFETPASQRGFFVVNLDKDTPPLPYSKFNTKLAGERHRLVDTSALGKVVQQQLAAITAGQNLDGNIKISPYFYVNNNMDFIAPGNSAVDEDGATNYIDDMEETVQKAYAADEWSLVDQGAGGFAVVKNNKPKDSIRVGDIIGIVGDDAKTAAGKWDIGVIRWLMIRQNKIYKVGIQTLGKEVHALAVRAIDGSPQEKQYRRVFLLDEPSGNSRKCIITAKGMYAEERELEIYYNNKAQAVTASTLIESTISFDCFSIA